MAKAALEKQVGKTTKGSLKKVLKIVLALIALVIGLPAVIVTTFLLWPPAILNSGLLKLALRAGGSAAGISSQFRKAELHVSSDNLLRKKVFLHFDDICVDSKSGFVKGCFSEFSLNFKFQLQKPYVKIVEVGPIVVVGQNFNLHVTPSPPQAEAKPSHLFQDILPDDLHELHILPFDIRIEQAGVSVAGIDFHGRVRLTDDQSLGALKPWNIRLDIDGQEMSEELVAQTKLVLSSQAQILTGPIAIDGDIKAKTALTKPFEATLHAALFEPGHGFSARVSTARACLNSKNGPLRGCLGKLDVGVQGIFDDQGLSIKTLAPLQLESSHFAINIDKLSGPATGTTPVTVAPTAVTKAQTSATESEPAPDLLKQLSGLQFENVNVQLPDVRLITGGEEMGAQLKITSKAQDLGLNLKVTEPASKLSAHADLKVQRGHEVLIMSGPIGLKSAGLILDTRTNLQLSSRELEFSIDALLDDKPWGAHAFVKGSLAGSKLKGTLTKLGAQNGSMIFQGPPSDPCVFDIDLNRRSQLGCNISLKFTDKEIDTLVGNPVLDLKMDLTTSFPPTGESPWSGFVVLKVPQLKNQVVSASGEVRALFESTRFDRELLKNLNIQTDFKLEITDFADWVNKTYSTPFAVPAPINALKGRIVLSSKGTLKGVYSKIPLHFASELRGQDQAFVIDGNGTLGTVAQGNSYVPELDAEVLFREVQLMLPRYPDSKLNASPPPALVPDARITNMKAVRKAERGDLNEKPGFLYNVHLKTVDGSPIKLVSNLTLGPIPIGLDLTVKTVEGLRGKVGIQKFPLELFGHKADIVRLNLEFVSMRLEENRIDGEATIGINDYKIIIDLSGTPKAPVVRFHSEPPLPQNQIIPVVLFGKTPESLDVDQKNSSNNLQAALQDQALPLASFFFLASTPVESVGYDTQQKIFTAKFRLRPGLSLDVGSNGSQMNQIGLNKRLGKSWSIRTYMTNPTDQSQSQSVTAFLEKLFQY